MPLDPQVKELLTKINLLLPTTPLTPQEFRKVRNELFIKMFNNEKVGLYNIRDMTIPVRNGDIKVRVYFPNQRENLPAVVYYHGGGFVYGNLDTHDSVCRLISKLSNTIIVSVDYRLAPEHKFPTQVYDAYDVVKWLANNGGKLSIDTSKIAVAGDSAGGNLSTVVSILDRDNGENVVKYQIMIYPVVNMLDSSPSMYNYGDGYFLTYERILWYNKQYVKEDSDYYNPLASPILAESHNLPPALIITAEYDPLRDQGEMYAHKLKVSGVKTISLRYNGMIHGFVSFYEYLDTGKEAIHHIASSIRKMFNVFY
ncbi:alpha/beta hydrolase [Saccharolobus solfataricus]|uniref:Lipase (LipP-2) n=3 Tax=Saccharolobus solfataricus TaxID=2287 RepID=Q97VT8_SACS2|nr:alpha/beta hydrolase [Saccharolobus solfataricus]AAK42652.1 Lipase (lipP-2) [Saccharolobus solfataricus P2]AKA72748.1 alpha/beta hydrolase [Saccharolobus solfataricus]AKA75447.1 alpha/beta hydrolase [Saccharolobus solfataricus]AKA78140.1 alpha/beta hydrolase [Saccharolobus solfataricus]AZF67259.1 alpha/beta hydrolase [Saccharolobus solfataricus]